MSDPEQAPFSSHLDELRKRLIYIIAGVMLAFTLVFSLWAGAIVRYIQEIAVVERAVPAAHSAINDNPAAAIQVAGSGAVRDSAFTADRGLVVFVDPASAFVPVPAPGTTPPLVFTGRLKPGTRAEARDDAVFLELDVSDPTPRTLQVTVPADAPMRLRGTGVVNLAAREGTTQRMQVQFSAISPLETFSTTMRVALYASLVFAYPWAMLQLYLFMAPGLYRHERRFFKVAIPSIFVLFTAGAAFGRYILLPISIGFLLDFNVEAYNLRTDYSLAQFLNLVFTLTFGLGFVFQIPLLVAPLIRFGLVPPDFFKRYRKYTVFAAIVIGAVISPTGMIWDMFIAGAPVVFLVEFGVIAGKLWKRAVLRAAEREALQRAKNGDQVNVEELAGGLAVDLEKRLKEFAAGGAREFARELMTGMRSSGDEISTMFDDDYTDDQKPPVEVRLKPRPKPESKTPDVPDTPAVKPDQVFTPATPVAEPGSATDPTMDATAIAAADAAPTSGNGNGKHEQYPDRPWVEGIDENLARYVEDRVSQRLEQLMERELRPWMERVEHELRNRKQDN
ncbi:MAG: twin-arginine translocase subunit TatC [Planctomycetes bacterium]|jgi:sec-independent protein translocase protein TatC|nr:twin-arginine translocase subunit TatC [Planctomycetota bacterium]MCL4729852.1 twin-arginine translocase subunit TatC [Planctomycetota bacterium]